jgi:uncharacterized protein
MRVLLVNLMAAIVLALNHSVAFSEKQSEQRSEQRIVLEEQHAKAMKALERGDLEIAHRILSQESVKGAVESQTALGLMYDKGIGVAQNYRKAVSFFRQAAERNDPIAQYHLGVKYVNGHGVEEDPSEAYIWFAISFNNGYESAADPLRILNQTLSTVEKQQALDVVVKKMEKLGR